MFAFLCEWKKSEPFVPKPPEHSPQPTSSQAYSKKQLTETTPMLDLTDANRVHPRLNVWRVPEMDKRLGFDAKTLQAGLESNYPSVGVDEEIKWGVPQWVKGENRALRYRGNVLKREKMWFQDECPVQSKSFLRYLYTGWQWRVLPATAGVQSSPEMEPVVHRLKEWTVANGYAAPNHYIVTRYRDGDHGIGAHFDKPTSIEKDSLITVIKLGEVGRPFRLEWLDETLVFEDVLPPGTGVVMTLESNMLTKHSVPVRGAAGSSIPVSLEGNSGSIVARTIVDKVSWDETSKRISNAEAQAAKVLGKRKE